MKPWLRLLFLFRPYDARSTHEQAPSPPGPMTRSITRLSYDHFGTPITIIRESPAPFGVTYELSKLPVPEAGWYVPQERHHHHAYSSPHAWLRNPQLAPVPAPVQRRSV